MREQRLTLAVQRGRLGQDRVKGEGGIQLRPRREILRQYAPHARKVRIPGRGDRTKPVGGTALDDEHETLRRGGTRERQSRDKGGTQYAKRPPPDK